MGYILAGCDMETMGNSRKSRHRLLDSEHELNVTVCNCVTHGVIQLLCVYHTFKQLSNINQIQKNSNNDSRLNFCCPALPLQIITRITVFCH